MNTDASAYILCQPFHLESSAIIYMSSILQLAVGVSNKRWTSVRGCSSLRGMASRERAAEKKLHPSAALLKRKNKLLIAPVD